MIEVGGAEVEPTRTGYGTEEMKQGERVAAARQGNEHPGALWNQRRVTFERGAKIGGQPTTGPAGRSINRRNGSCPLRHHP
jgi:hypothetical protein